MDSKYIISDTVSFYFTVLSRLICSNRHDFIGRTNECVSYCKIEALKETKAYYNKNSSILLHQDKLWTTIVENYLR